MKLSYDKENMIIKESKMNANQNKARFEVGIMMNSSMGIAVKAEDKNI